MSGNTEHLQVFPWTVHHELLSPLLTSRQINPTLWLNFILGSNTASAAPLHRRAWSLCTGLARLTELPRHPVIHPVDRGPAGGIKRSRGGRGGRGGMTLEAQTCTVGAWDGLGRDGREGNWKWLLHINSVIIQRGVLSQNLSRPCLWFTTTRGSALIPRGGNLSAKEFFGRRSTNTRNVLDWVAGGGVHEPEGPEGRDRFSFNSRPVWTAATEPCVAQAPTIRRGWWGEATALQFQAHLQEDPNWTIFGYGGKQGLTVAGYTISLQ